MDFVSSPLTLETFAASAVLSTVSVLVTRTIIRFVSQQLQRRKQAVDPDADDSPQSDSCPHESPLESSMQSEKTPSTGASDDTEVTTRASSTYDHTLWKEELPICSYTKIPSLRRSTPHHTKQQTTDHEVQRFAKMCSLDGGSAKFLLDRYQLQGTRNVDTTLTSLPSLPLGRFEVLSLGNTTGQVKLLIPLQRRASNVQCRFAPRGFDVSVTEETTGRRRRLLITDLARTINSDTSSWLLSDNKKKLKLFLRKEDPTLTWYHVTLDPLDDTCT